ncbi:MAG: hypothetical protein ACLGHJ_09610 [Gammaproteobacteria bacterium]
MRMHAPLILVGTLAGTLTATSALAQAPSSPVLSNPQISVILDGVAYADDVQGAGNEWLDEAAGILHAHGSHTHGHEGLAEGFNLRGAEVVMSATVDQLFDARANLVFSDDGVEIEEAFFTTRALPAGWQVKGGRFFSGFGYANSRHPHSWDFVDQNLAYRSLLGGHGLKDTGLQLVFSPATDTWMQFGIEVLQGHEQETLGTAVDEHDLEDLLADAGLVLAAPSTPSLDRRGPQLYTGFLRVGPDLGTDHALQLGLSYALHKSQQEAHAEGEPVTDIFVAEGEASLLGLEAVYKRAATGRQGQGGWRINAEYLLLDKDLLIADHTDAAEIGEPLTGTQDAFYVQGVYGFAPRWEAGLRYDATGTGRNEIMEGGSTMALGDSSRISAALTFRPSEYAYWRLQLADADIVDESGARENFSQLMLQFNLSLGAHGAHAF